MNILSRTIEIYKELFTFPDFEGAIERLEDKKGNPLSTTTLDDFLLKTTPYSSQDNLNYIVTDATVVGFEFKREFPFFLNILLVDLKSLKGKQQRFRVPYSMPKKQLSLYIVGIIGKELSFIVNYQPKGKYYFLEGVVEEEGGKVL